MPRKTMTHGQYWFWADMRRLYAGWLVLVHINPMAEAFPDDTEQLKYMYPNVDRVAELMRNSFGDPVFVNDRLAGWVVGSPG